MAEKTVLYCRCRQSGGDRILGLQRTVSTLQRWRRVWGWSPKDHLMRNCWWAERRQPLPALWFVEACPSSSFTVAESTCEATIWSLHPTWDTLRKCIFHGKRQLSLLVVLQEASYSTVSHTAETWGCEGGPPSASLSFDSRFPWKHVLGGC